MKSGRKAPRKPTSLPKASSSSAESKRLIQTEVAKLRGSDEQAATVAAAALVMLAQNSQVLQEEMLEAIPELLRIMRTSGSDALQRNSVVALIAIVHLGELSWEVAQDQNAMSMAIALLDSPKQILGVRLNAAVLAGAMIEGGESGPANFYSANGLESVIPILVPDTDAELLEAAVDIICKLAAVPGARPTLTSSGMLTKLTGLLGLEGQPETLVRVLMALAMLLGDGAELLRELAQAPKAIDRLAAIIRSSEDPDSKAIATSIFANLANDSSTREAVSRALQTAASTSTNGE